MRARGTSLLAAGLLVTGLVTACSDEPDEDPDPPTITASPSAEESTSDQTPEQSPSEDGTDQASSGPPRVARTLVEGLRVPWGIDFLPDGTAVVTERDTRRVLLVDERGEVTEVGVVEAAAPQGEAGLLGVAVSPDFEDDQLVYLYATTAEDNRVLRAELDGTTPDDMTLGEPEVVLEGIPNGFIHDGGRLEFGPDGHLYVSTGETGVGELAQDRGSLAGKILRITPDGEPAPGNPDPDSPVWTWGHRNVQGLAFDDDGNLWASEFGDSTFDELNLIEKGENYGWPAVEGRGPGSDYRNPQVVWDTSQASPSGLAYAEGRLWLAALRGTRLWRIDVADGRASRPTDFFVGDYGRLRTVVAAPDGTLWLTTSNHDGRGVPAAADDRILVVRPGG